jgi:hypothetical protein
MLDSARDTEKTLIRIYDQQRVSREAVERIEQRLNKCIESEKETQQILLEAGITNDETVMLWLSSASETIDRDVAELEELESRHLDEINAFFRSKGATIDET